MDKLLTALQTPPDAALAIATQGPDGPHIINSWNSYVQVIGRKLLIPVGRMYKTEKNIDADNRVKLTITNREVQGKTYKGTGFLINGTAVFAKNGPNYASVTKRFPWARAALEISIETMEQTL